MKRTTRYIAIFGVTILFGITACGPVDEEERPEVPEDVDVRPDVVFAEADDRPLTLHIESSGVVAPNREITIRPRVSGFVEISLLDDGNYVEQGDTIIAFDRQEWEHQLSQAQNEFDKAMVDYNIEQRQRQSRSAGQESGESSGEEENDRMLRITTGLAAAEVDLDRARLDYSYSVVTAPYSGYISVPERISPGAYITSGTELGRLIDDQLVQVRLDVLEAELSRLERGMPVRITTPVGDYREGVIRAVAPVVDPESKTGQVIVEVPNPDRILKPGMTVEGRIQIQSHSGQARVPRSAILSRDGGRTLLFKLNNDIVEWIYVDPVFQTSEWAIIDHEDVAPGDTIAVAEHFALSHLQPVRVRMAGEIHLEDSGEVD